MSESASPQIKADDKQSVDKMNKSREEIPVWTWFNGKFLFQFDEQLRTNPNQSISEFFTDFLTNQRIEDYSFYHTKNQGTVILLMYGLLVVPREIWERSGTNFRFLTRSKFSVAIPTDGNLDTFDFLRLLRNSLSHANFSIDASQARVTFWNNRPDGTKNFETEIAWDDLGEFLAEVGLYYVNDLKNVPNADLLGVIHDDQRLIN